MDLTCKNSVQIYAMAPTLQREGSLHAAVMTASRFLLRDELRYTTAYTWLVLFSAIDILLTRKVMLSMGGTEANPLAAYVIEQGGFFAASVFKYALVVLAIILCEVIGRMKDQVGRRLSRTMVMIGVIPIVWTMLLPYSSMVLPALMGH